MSPTASGYALLERKIRRDRPAANPTRGWAARIEIELAHGPTRTHVARRRTSGPLYLQRALYPENDGTCHLYLLHPPGGMVQGDTLAVRVAAPEGTRSLITTPAAGKLYRTPRDESAQDVHVHVARGAQLEWLPQETIVFDGVRAHSRLTLDIARHGRVIAWDIVCLGRPAAGEDFDDGCFDSHMELRIDGELHWIERSRIPGASASPFTRAAWGLDGQPAIGTLIAYGFKGIPSELMDALRELAAGQQRFGVTEIDGVVVARVLGRQAQDVRAMLTQVWRIVRGELFGKPPVVPRIWLT